MKKLLFLIVSYLLLQTIGIAQWQHIPQFYAITALTATDDKIFAGQGTQNIIYQSMNGVEWDSIATLESNFISNLEVIDNYIFATLNRGWFDTSYPVASIYRSSDSGYTWDSLHASISGSHNILKHKGYLFSQADGSIIRSPDMGESWTELAFPLSMYHVIGSNDLSIFTHHEDDGLFKSDDAGENWQSVSTFPIIEKITSIVSFNNNLFILAESNNMDQIYSSEDNGESWQLIMDGLENVNSILWLFICDEYIFCIVYGSQYKIYAANCWQPIWFEITDNLNTGSIQTIEKFQDTLFIGGYWGIWYRPFYEITRTNEVLPKSKIIPLQNYPNPFSDITTIPVRIEKMSHITLSIYNLSGELIKLLAEGNYPRGLHKFKFEKQDLELGVYLYKLDVPEGSCSRKMIIY